MAATQDADHIWNITKTPATVSFPTTCNQSEPTSLPVSIKVEWARLAATPNGDITVVTNIYATNPASRIITVSVTDEIRNGATTLDTVCNRHLYR